jgi:hypothetical protein
MLDERGLKPAAEVRVTWKNFPYKNAIDTIGEGRAQPVAPVPLPARAGDAAWLKHRVEDVFSEAGLYDVRAGSGTITVELLSYGRWTYREIFKSFLVDTGWIFLIPATLRVNYQLIAHYDGPSGTASAEATGQNNTTFHALLLPLYPLCPFGAKEHSMLKKMLWKSASDIYTGLKRGK